MELLSRSYQSDHNLLKNSLMYGKRRVCQGKWLLHVKQTDCRCSEMMNQVMFKHTKNYLFAFLVMIKESWAHTSQSSPLLDLGLRDVDCTTWPFFAVEEEEFVLLPPPPSIRWFCWSHQCCIRLVSISNGIDSRMESQSGKTMHLVSQLAVRFFPSGCCQLQWYFHNILQWSIVPLAFISQNNFSINET